MRLKIKILFTGIIICLGYSCKTDNNQQISSLVEKYISEYDFNGIIKVYHNDRIVFNESYGFADFTTQRRLTPETAFRIGSVSKTFTAISTLILVERGELELNDSIGKFLRIFSDSINNVTIEQLLSHTSGIPDYIDGYPSTSDSLTNLNAIQSIREKDYLYFKSGSRFRYSNSGYVILGLLIESITNQPFQDFVNQNILQPLDMNDTYFLSSQNFMLTDRALSHDSTGRQWEIPLYVKGDGGMVSTAEDLNKWYHGLVGGKLINDTTFMKAITQHSLKNEEKVDYGLGFEVTKTKLGFDIIGHRGGLGGTGVYFLFESKKENLIIAMTNNNCQKTGEMVEGISMIMNNYKTEY